jgi:hypothetical protein
MKQFKNAEGLIKISWQSFSKIEVTELAVRVLLCMKVSKMYPDEISKTINWYKQLKIQVLNYCKDQAMEDVLYGASQIDVISKTLRPLKLGGKLWILDCCIQACTMENNRSR